MRTAISPAPSAGPIHKSRDGTALPFRTAHWRPEELWATCSRRATLFGWVLRHRLLVLGLALAAVLGMATILPALGIQSEPGSQLAQSALSGLGGASTRGSLTAVAQLPSPRIPTPERSRGPLSLITPSAVPSDSPSTAQSMLVGLDLPAGVTATIPGNGREGQQSFRSLLLAFALAVFLVYLVTASQLESLLNPLSLLFTVPMGLIAAAWGLYATGATLNAAVLIGTILLAGILVNNAIVLIDAIKNARARGTRTREAMIQASRARVRPIIVTSIGTVLGLLPMAIGVGEGIGIRRPMTITVIAGLAVATFLVAVAIPVVYTLLDPRADKTI